MPGWSMTSQFGQEWMVAQVVPVVVVLVWRPAVPFVAVRRRQAVLMAFWQRSDVAQE